MHDNRTNRFFPSHRSSPVRFNDGGSDLEARAITAGSDRGLPIILDWLVPSESLREEIGSRIKEVGCGEYTALRDRIFASSRRDTLSALAQPWFGVIMTREESKACVIQARPTCALHLNSIRTGTLSACILIPRERL